MKRKIWIVVLTLPLGLLLVAAVLVSHEWEAPRIGGALLRRAAELGGVRLDVEGVRFHVLKGIRLDGVEARVDSPGGDLVAEIERVELRHRMKPLLQGRIEADELRIVRPSLKLLAPDVGTPPSVAGAAGSPPTSEEEAAGSIAATETGANDASEPAAESSGLAIAIDRIVVVDGTLEMEGAEEGAAPTRITGLDLELVDLQLDPAVGSAVLGVSGTGTLAADEVQADPLVATGLKSALSLAGGEVILSEIALAASEGPVAAESFVLDLREDPYTFRMKGGRVAPIDTAGLLGTTAGGFGAAELVVEVSGSAETLGLDGQGRLSVAEGTLPSMPLLEALEMLLGHTELIGGSYRPFEIPFRMLGTRIELDPTPIRTADMSLVIGGFADLEGTVDLTATIRIPREGFEVDEIPEEVLELLTDDSGYLNLHAALVGPLERPKAILDKSAWGNVAKKAVQREIQRGIEKEAAKLLQDLFGGDG